MRREPYAAYMRKPQFALELLRGEALIAHLARLARSLAAGGSLGGENDASSCGSGGAYRVGGGLTMQDLIWILVMIGLVAATLAYADLCDHA